MDDSNELELLYGQNHMFYRVGAVLGWTSSSLSIFGSVTIAYIIIRKQHWRHSAFQRIMSSGCIADIIASVACFLQPLLIPTFTGLDLAVGNLATCQFVGLLFSYNIASFMHSAVISLYFCLTIRFRWSETLVKKYLEPWIYLVPWSIASVIGVVGASYQLFYPDVVFGVCVLECHHHPEQCPRKLLKTWLGYIDTFSPLLGALLGMIFTAMVFHAVCRQTRRSQSYASGLSRTQRKRVQAVAVQAMCYEGAFLVSFLSLLSPLILSGDGKGSPEQDGTNASQSHQGALLVVLLLFPLQGFLNWVIFLRPMLVRWKNAHSEKTWWWAYRQILSGHPTPITTATAHLSHKVLTSNMALQLATESCNLKPCSSPFKKRTVVEENCGDEDCIVEDPHDRRAIFPPPSVDP